MTNWRCYGYARGPESGFMNAADMALNEGKILRKI
jgi:hypothetical protein